MKKWLVTHLTIIFGILLSIGSFNYLMDPLWCFSHQHFLQSHQGSFNERQQKVNLIHFHSFDYNALLIGSSRMTVHNPATLPENIKAFNIAFDAMRLYEFNEYIEYAKKANKKDFEYIIIGLDFVTIIGKDPNQLPLNTYQKTTLSPGYRYKMLLGYDTLVRSLKNLRNHLMGGVKNKFKTYDENYVAHAFLRKPDEIQTIITNYTESMSMENIKYDRTNYLDAIRTLKRNNPNTRFIVFTTPMPAPVVNKLLSSPNNQRTFNLWVNDIYREFGPFWHFFSTNMITQNYPLYFVDEAHYTSEVANCINQKLFHESCQNALFKDFGLYITSPDTLNTVIQKPIP